jgi:hypothetical protein
MSTATAEHPPTLGNTVHSLFKGPKHVLHLSGMPLPEIQNFLQELQPDRPGLNINPVFHGAACMRAGNNPARLADPGTLIAEADQLSGFNLDHGRRPRNKGAILNMHGTTILQYGDPQGFRPPFPVRTEVLEHKMDNPCGMGKSYGIGDFEMSHGRQTSSIVADLDKAG